MCNLALAGEWEAAADIDAKLATLNDLLFSEANPIPVKWAMAHRGMIDSGIRLPLTPLSEACRALLRRQWRRISRDSITTFCRDDWLFTGL